MSRSARERNSRRPSVAKPPAATADRPSDAEIAHITPALRGLAVPIESLRPDPWNARRHGERNRASINFSLKTFGQQRPISVDADGVILAGNGTYEEAKALGWRYIAAVRSHLVGDAARAYAIADNRSGELAERDASELSATLEELADGGFDVAGLEISNQELDGLLDADNGAGGAAVEPKKGGAGAGELREQWKTIVEHASEAEQAAFLERMAAEGRKCRALVT